MTENKPSPTLIQKIILLSGIIFMLSLCTIMGVQSFKKASKSLSTLKFVSGEVTSKRYIKFRYKGLLSASTKNMLVLQIDGCTDEFGFTEGTTVYDRLMDVHETNRIAEVYYDSSDERIEQNVTRSIYDLKIGEYQALSITEIKKRHLPLAILFFIPLLFFLYVVISGPNERKQYKKKTRASYSLLDHRE